MPGADSVEAIGRRRIDEDSVARPAQSAAASGRVHVVPAADSVAGSPAVSAIVKQPRRALREVEESRLNAFVDWRIIHHPLRCVSVACIAARIAPEVPARGEGKGGPLLQGIEQHPMIDISVQIRVRSALGAQRVTRRSPRTRLPQRLIGPESVRICRSLGVARFPAKVATLPFTAGGDLWSYTSCNAGYGNAPEWMVDYPPINERIQAGFLNFTQGATGLLYYRADGWTAGNAIGSWNNVDTTACGSGLGRPGDGIFVYPPAPIASTESAPGIRLKAIRDGIQDYEYAQILKNLGHLSTVDTTLLPIATSWSSWSHDPNALQNARTQLGQLLHQLARKQRMKIRLLSV